MSGRWVFLLGMLGLLAVVGCVTETKSTGPLVWVDSVSYGSPPGGSPGLPEPPPEGAPSRPEPPDERSPVARRQEDPDRIVKVPQSVLDDLLAWINRPQCLLANRIVVDASRIPFQPTLIPVADPNYVETITTGEASAGDHAILMRSRQAMALVERDRPRLRVGEGIDLVADSEIHVRHHRRVTKERPVFLVVRGLGSAVYRDEGSGERITGDAVTLTVELVPGPGGLVLRHEVR